MITIFHHYLKDVCKSKKLKESLLASGKLKNITTEVKQEYVKCFDYDRYDSTCTEIEMIEKDIKFANFSEDCVIAADVSSARGRLVDAPEKLNAIEIIENLSY